ncbi:MAG: polysulfide reductase NrfD [Deltaproteobacteria bacterium]|nr:polysulfide reductase NrfD [Deltaproteobacteria bacterium]
MDTTMYETSSQGQADYEWMIRETPPREWADAKGMWLSIAFFVSEIGAGLFFLSLFINYRPGFILGYLLSLVIGGLTHIIYLGNPQRFWRVLMKPKTSELSRGVWVILLYSLIGGIMILPAVFPDLPWTGYHLSLKLIMGVVCVLMITHGAATMSVIRAIPSWNSTMLLPWSVISGIWVGSQVLVVMPGSGAHELVRMETLSLILLSIYAVTIVLYLWGTSHASGTAKLSIKELVAGMYAKSFYLGVVGAGIAIPMILILATSGSQPLFWLIALRLVFVVIGDMTLRSLQMKSAYYNPLI